MKGYVTDSTGVRWELPALRAWRMDYTDGVPCDSFSVCCLWNEKKNPTQPRQWVTFTAEYRGEVVFTGVVDECRTTLDGRVARHVKGSERWKKWDFIPVSCQRQVWKEYRENTGSSWPVWQI